MAYVATEDVEHHGLAISRVFALSGMTVALFKMLLYLDGFALGRTVWVLLVASIAFPLGYTWVSTKGSVVAGTSIVSVWWNEFQGGQLQSNPQFELLNSMVATVWVLVLAYPFHRSWMAALFLQSSGAVLAIT